jgi:hypothetical protein
MARRAGIRRVTPPVEFSREDAAMREWLEDGGFYVSLGNAVELDFPVALDKPEIEGPDRELP